MSLLWRMIHARESARMHSLYQQIHQGQPVGEIEKLARTQVRNISYGYASYSSLMQQLQVDPGDQSRHFMEFTHPGQWRLPRVVVETTPPDQGIVIARAVYWLD